MMLSITDFEYILMQQSETFDREFIFLVMTDRYSLSMSITSESSYATVPKALVSTYYQKHPTYMVLRKIQHGAVLTFIGFTI